MNWMINRKMVTGAFAATVAACGLVYAGVPYANNFSERTSEALPSDRWMETTYKTGSLARRLAASAITEYSPYANERDNQDGWAAKKIWPISACATRGRYKRKSFLGPAPHPENWNVPTKTPLSPYNRRKACIRQNLKRIPLISDNVFNQPTVKTGGLH